MEEKNLRNDYSQQLFDEFVKNAKVPEYALQIATGNGTIFVATTDKAYYNALLNKFDGARVTKYNTLFYGYSAIISNEEMQLGEQVKNVVAFNSTVWGRGFVENSYTFVSASEPEAMITPIQLMLNVHEVRAGKSFASMSNAGNDGKLVCKLALNNQDAVGPRATVFGDCNTFVVRQKLFDAIDKASAESEM